MSASVIAFLNASAEIPGMPPCVTSEPGLADTGEDLVPAPDVAQSGWPDIDLLQVDLNGSDGSGDGVAGDSLKPVDGASFPLDVSTQAPGGDPDLWLYRDRTIALLRRYLRLSLQVGRMPSLLGREIFRARFTSYQASTFEDTVIFVHDVERSLEMLSEFDKRLIAKVVLQEYSQEEAGRQLGCGLRHAARCFAEALDRVTESFLKRELMDRLPSTKPESEKSCQGGKTGQFPVSDSEQAKNKS